MNKKVISLVLSLALIVSCFACMSGLSVYAIDNTASSLRKAPATTVTTAEKKAAKTVVEAYPDTYPEWHCKCGNIWLTPGEYNSIESGVTLEDVLENDSENVHYLWGEGNCKADGGEGCDSELIKWTAGFTPAEGMAGNYYLTADVSTSTQVGIGSTTPYGTNTAEREELNIDLNGFNYTKTSSSRTFTGLGRPNSHLSITDTKGGSVVQTTGGNTNAGMLVWLPTNNTNSNKLSTDVLCGTYSSANFYGGRYVCKSNGTAVVTQIYKRGTVNFWDGVEVDSSGYNSTNNNAKSNGGLIRMEDAESANHGKLGIYGATIKGYATKTVVGSGAVIYAGSYADITIKNATIVGTACSGPASETVSSTTYNSNGGTIAVGKAPSTLTIENSTISGGSTTKGNGGNIYIKGTDNSTYVTFNLKNSTISGGTSSSGGNVNLQAGARLYYEGSTITGGTSTNAGGNVVVSGSGARLEQLSGKAASTISNGTAATTGGNIHLAGGTVVCRNTTISGGTAGTMGGNIYSNSNLTLTGCTLTGGTANSGADYSGQSVYINGNIFNIYTTTSVDGEFYVANNTATARSHIISGTPTLSNLVLGAPHASTTSTYFNNTLNLDGLNEGASITLTVEADPDYLDFAGTTFASVEEALTRSIATNVTDDRASYITVTNEGYEFVNDGGTGHLAVYVPPVPTHTHKIAADSATAAAMNLGQDEVTYTAVSDEAELAAAIAGISAETPTNIYLEDDIQLTDATIASTNAYALRMAVANATVNLCLNGYTITAYDGGEDAATNASSVFQFGATTNFNVCDCAEGEDKGGLESARTTTSSSSVQYGGICYIAYSSNVRFYDIKVTGSAAKDKASIAQLATGNLYAYDTEFINPADCMHAIYGGNANSLVRLYGCTINNASSSAIYMSTATTAAAKKTIVNNCTISSTSADPAIYMPGLLDIVGGSISNTNGIALQLNNGSTTNITGNAAITSATTVTNNATIMSQGTLTMTGGSITGTGSSFALYLNNVGSNVTLTNVTLSAASRIANVGTSGTAVPTLTLNNCTASRTAASTGDGGLFRVYGTLNINGGTYTGIDAAQGGGAIAVYNLTSNAAGGTVNIYGGATVTGGACDTNGGGTIYVKGNLATVNIYGDATVTGAAVTTHGGTIYNAGTVNVYGNATVNGGTVSGSNKRGGNIYNAGTLAISESATISGGDAGANDGGAIYNTSAGTVNISGGTVTGGTAARGGNIYNAGGTVNLSGNAVIKDGNAVNTETDSGGQGGGGNIYTTSSGTFTMAGTAQVKDGTATGAGGNIYNNATMTVTGGSITGGEAGTSGGNLMFGSSAVSTLTDVTVSGGICGNNGGNIRSNSISLVLEGVTSTNGTTNSASGIGEDIVVTKGTIEVDADCEIDELLLVYPAVTYDNATIEEGATIGNYGLATYNATKEKLVRVSENVIDTEGTDGAFNNWYLLVRGQKKVDGSYGLRFTSLVDGNLENYKVAGFEYSINGGETVTLDTHDVYTRNYENGEVKYISDYSLETDYYFHGDVEFSAEDVATGTLTVTAYLTDMEDNTVKGETKTVVLNKLFPTE